MPYERINEFLNKIAEKIREVAYLEERVICNIINEVMENNCVNKISNNIVDDKNFEEVDVDILGLLNNKGFGGRCYSDIKPDMTGHDEYFLEEYLPNDRMVKVGEVSFYIYPQLDNFIAANQRISIGVEGARKIYLLGCAEWGNGSGKVKVAYSSHIETLLLEFQDWYYSELESAFVAWKGKTQDYQGNIVDRAIFCLDYELMCGEELLWMEFPEIENVHIFGIKLLKEKIIG